MGTKTAEKFEPALLTCKQAAQLVGVAESTLWRWSRSGLAPRPLKIGRGTRAATRYRAAELREWIDAGCPRCDGAAGGTRPDIHPIARRAGRAK